METAKNKYLGELRIESTHLRSGQVIQTDAPVDNNGKGMAFSPTDLLATSLACCMLTIMGIRANKIRINIDGTTASVTKIMAESPRRVDEVKVEITMPHSDYTEQQRAQMWDAAENCPVAKVLVLT